MKSSIALMLLLSIISCTPENHFEISGTFKGDIEDQWIYLSKFMAEDQYSDSLFMEGGKFQFSGICDYPESYLIHNHKDSALAWFHLYPESGKIKINMDPDDWVYGSSIQGGKINEEFNINVRFPREEFIKYREETLQKIAVSDSIQKSELEEAMEAANNANLRKQMEYVRNNPDSPISPYLLARNFFGFPIEEAEIILSNFSSENKKTAICISFQEKLDMLKAYNNSTSITE